MKITDIKQQVKRQDRYSIYVDGKYSFSLSERELMHQGLRIGQEFDSKAFEEIKDTALEDKAYMRALDMLSRRQRSVWEMTDYLTKKGYQYNIIEKIVNKLTKRGLLDDGHFAQSWVSNRRLLKNVSKRRLKQELQQKRISDEIISDVLEGDETNEQEVIKTIVQRRQTQSRYQDSQKLISYLLRQGFSYDDVKQVLKDSDVNG